MTARQPRFRVYIAQSLDGFIASADGTIDWLEPYPTATFGFERFIDGIATIVMGRTSYDQVLTFGEWPYAGTPAIVLTSRSFEPPRPDVEVWRGSLPELIDELGQRQVGDVWVMGGAATIGAFLDLGRIDRLDVFILPLLLGSGVPLHTASEPRALRFEAAEALEFGVVRLQYAAIQPEPAGQ